MFEFGVIDNLSSSKSVEIMAGYLRGATGDFTIAKTADATYDVSINVKLLGVQYVVNFDDKCISVDYAPEKKVNYFDFKGAEYTITSTSQMLNPNTGDWDWELIEKYIAAAVDLGINMIMVPVHTPPLDTAINTRRPCVQLVDITKNGVGSNVAIGYNKEV